MKGRTLANIPGWGCKLVGYLGESNDNACQNYKCTQQQFLRIYPRDIYVWVGIYSIFLTAKVWKQPKHPSLGKRINKLPYMHTMEHSAVIKMNKISIEKLIGSDQQDTLIRKKQGTETHV